MRGINRHENFHVRQSYVQEAMHVPRHMCARMMITFTKDFSTGFHSSGFIQRFDCSRSHAHELHIELDLPTVIELIRDQEATGSVEETLRLWANLSMNHESWKRGSCQLQYVPESNSSWLKRWWRGEREM